MALDLRAITHKLFALGGLELASAVVVVTLSEDEIDTVNKHVRVNDIPELTFTATVGGIATLNLPDNVNKTTYTVSVFAALTTDFTGTPFHKVKIRVVGADADLSDIVV